MFNHDPLPKIELQRLDLPTGRIYVTPDGNRYPSVTTVIGHKPSEWIDEWIERVGKEEAARVSARAAGRGTSIHDLCERYLLNKNPIPDMFDAEMFSNFKPLLNRISNIRLLEGRMYSDILRMSGTTDCLGDFDGILSIIDFKTSKRMKHKDDIEGYFLQSTAYGVMALERYDVKVEQIVILIAVDDDRPQVFIENPKKFIKPLFSLRKEYDEFIKNPQI